MRLTHNTVIAAGRSPHAFTVPFALSILTDTATLKTPRLPTVSDSPASDPSNGSSSLSSSLSSVLDHVELPLASQTLLPPANQTLDEAADQPAATPPPPPGPIIVPHKRSPIDSSSSDDQPKGLFRMPMSHCRCSCYCN
jgi:hypothetical protein